MSNNQSKLLEPVNIKHMKELKDKRLVAEQIRSQIICKCGSGNKKINFLLQRL